jgi:hypothetical protein
MAGKQNASRVITEPGNASSPQTQQTLRVRRSTFVPGWAVPPRVLLVDDDTVTRKLSSKFLQVFGCTTDVAVDGVGAVNKMNLERYDLVLMVRVVSLSLFLAPAPVLPLAHRSPGYCDAQTGRCVRDFDDQEVRPADAYHLHDEQFAADGYHELLFPWCVRPSVRFILHFAYAAQG